MQELFSLEDVFDVMMELETLGNQHYLEMEKLTSDYQLKALFNGLAKQEMTHKELYAKYKNLHISFETNQLTLEYKDYMDALLKGTIHFLKGSKEIRDLKQGYEIAINLEKDTILFLGEIRGILDSTYYAAIDEVLNQEKSHLKALYKWQSTQNSTV